MGDPQSPCREVWREGELTDEGMESGAERCSIQEGATMLLGPQEDLPIAEGLVGT